MAEQTYRGWDVAYDPPPIPVRTSDWCAAHPDYDGEGDNRIVYAGSLAGLRAEIDAWIEERRDYAALAKASPTPVSPAQEG